MIFDTFQMTQYTLNSGWVRVHRGTIFGPRGASRDKGNASSLLRGLTYFGVPLGCLVLGYLYTSVYAYSVQIPSEQIYRDNCNSFLYK